MLVLVPLLSLLFTDELDDVDWKRGSKEIIMVKLIDQCQHT
jgi:hypothetical protein